MQKSRRAWYQKSRDLRHYGIMPRWFETGPVLGYLFTPGIYFTPINDYLCSFIHYKYKNNYKKLFREVGMALHPSEVPCHQTIYIYRARKEVRKQLHIVVGSCTLTLPLLRIYAPLMTVSGWGEEGGDIIYGGYIWIWNIN